MRRTFGRRFGFWVSMLVLPGILALEPMVASVSAAAPPPKRMPAVSSPPLQLPEPSIPAGDGLSVIDDEVRSADDLPDLGPEVVGRRDAMTEVFANADGSETVKLYSEPVNFQPAGSESWEKIDNTLVEDESHPGWVRNAANGWTVRFGPVGAGGQGGVELVTDGGVVRFAPETSLSSASIAPVVGTGEDSSSVTYPDVWPGVDVRYSVSSGRVKEEIIVEDGSRSSFPFVTEGLGLSEPTPEAPAAGESATGVADDEVGSPLAEAPEVTGPQAGRLRLAPVTVVGPEGRPVGSAAAGTELSVEPVDASMVSGSGVSEDSSAAIGEQSVAGVVPQRLVVSVDEAWMAEQVSADGPVVIDPTTEVIYASNLKDYEWVEEGSQGPHQNVCPGGSCLARIGRFFNSKFRTATQFPYWDKISGRDILYAGIWLGNRSLGDKYTDETGEHWVPVLSFLWLAAVTEGGTEPDFHSIEANPVPPEGWVESDEAADTAIFNVTPELTNAQKAGDPNVWWGFTGDENDVFSLAQYDSTVMVLNVNRKPPAPSLSSPAEGSLAIDTLTPTLSWSGAQTEQAAPAGDGDTLKYTAKISTNPDGASGLVAQSAEMDWSSAMSWQVPVGVLRDGVTYYWSAFASDGTTSTQSSVRKLTVDRRLGLGGVSPSDSLGAVSTNLVTGNPSLTVSGPQMPAVGGGVGVNFIYNGRQSLTGLTGTYHQDGDSDGELDGPGTDPVRLVRTDAQVSFDWGEGSPAPGVPTDRFWVRWQGNIRFPSHGTWQLGQRSDDGVHLRADGAMLVDDWGGGAVEDLPVWQTASGFAAGSSHRVSLEYKEYTGPAIVQLWVRNADPSAPVEEQNGFIVPADWLSPDRPDMAPGWSLSAADANVAYVRATVTEGTITLVGVDGATYAFTKQDNGSYKPPEGVDDVVIPNADGTVTVHDDAGLTYVFSPDGGIHSLRTALDDRRPAAAKNIYDDDGRLTQIKDPVSGRNVTFQYANGDGDQNTVDSPVGTRCPNVPALGSSAEFGIKDGMLCRVKYWDGSKTELYYFKATGLLSHIVNPGDSGEEVWHGFSYDAQGRLIRYADPMSRDVLWSGARTDSDSKRLQTEISYAPAPPGTTLSPATSKVQKVELPFAMQADTQRPSRSYEYYPTAPDGILTGGTAAVTRAGVTGSYRAVTYDHRGRAVEETDTAGLTSQVKWNGDDQQIATISPGGLLTATHYNNRHQPTETWGPAPQDWFDWPLYGTPPVPVPVPQAAHLAEIPHSITGYDENITGTQVRWWDHTGRNGTVVGHGWDDSWLRAGDDQPFTRPEGVPVNQNSARWSGDIVFPAEGDYILQLCVGVNDAAWLSVDGRQVTSHWYPTSDTSGYGCSTLDPTARWSITVHSNRPGDRHLLQIDYDDLGTNATETAQSDLLHLNWKTPAGVYETVPGTALAPGFGLVTSNVDADGKKTATEYADGNVGPQHGLVTKTIVDPDPGGLGLADVTTYETVGGTAKYLRRVNHILPAAPETVTNNEYYAGDDQTNNDPNTGLPNEAESRSNPCVSGSPAVNQGGMLKFDTAADPDAGGPKKAIQREKVYDASGRVVASRTGDEGTLTPSGGPGWTCTTYDGRGRAKTVLYPAFGAQTSNRTVTNNYKVDPDGSGPKVASPLVTSVLDSTGTITVETDLLGRVISYKDVFGNTTTFQYDLAGRETQNSGPVGTIVKSYDTADRLTQITRGGQVLANGFNYDTVTGRLLGVAYPSGTPNGNGTTGTFDYEANTGRLKKISWKGPGGAVLTTDEVTARSLGGDIKDELIDGADANTAGPNYVYDNAGRLTNAWVPGRQVQYSYGDNAASCAVPNMASGKNTNRTSQTVNGGTPTTYCYDYADRITSSTDTTLGGTPTYDTHGNTTSIFGETHGYDAADRHLTTVKGSTTVTYKRDATDRIVERTVGTNVVRYGATGSGDAPEFTTNASNAVLEVTYALPGGAMLTTRAGNASIWSYPNIHGDIVATANASGVKQGPTTVYDPYGNLVTGTLPDNSAGNFDYGWLGQHERPLEHEAAVQPVIEMGARQYSPLIGRFIEVDPVEGGSANDYDYVAGDPINSSDLAGTYKCTKGSKSTKLLDTLNARKLGGSGTRQVQLLCGSARKNWGYRHILDRNHRDEHGDQFAKSFWFFMRQTLKNPSSLILQSNGNLRYDATMQIKYYDLFGNITAIESYKFSVFVEDKTGRIVTAFGGNKKTDFFG